MGVFTDLFNLLLVSARALNRTGYINPLRREVNAGIDAFIASLPAGYRADDVTLFVLNRIGMERVVALQGNRTFWKLKQDFGLFIAQQLAVHPSIKRLETFRNPFGKSLTRKNRSRHTDWVTCYSRHRLTIA